MFGLIIAMISIGCMVQAPALAFVVLPAWIVAGCWALKVHLMERHERVQTHVYEEPSPEHWSPEWHKRQGR